MIGSIAKLVVIIYTVFIVQTGAVTVTNLSQWIVSNTNLMPKPDYRVAIASYNNSIYLFGGQDNNNHSVEFCISTHNFTERTPLPYQAYGAGQFYTQINDIFYWIHASTTYTNIIRYDLSKHTSQIEVSSTQIVRSLACLASHNDRLFMVGGRKANGAFSTLTMIYSTISKEWSIGAQMKVKRVKHSCIVHPRSHMLYAIGGFGDSGDLYSIEKIDINGIQSNSWDIVNVTLCPPPYSRAIIYYDSILVFGGKHCCYNYSSDIFRIDMATYSVSIVGKLPYVVAATAVVFVNDRIYAFGGTIAGSGTSTNQWTYSIVETMDPTIAPSSEPSTVPTIPSTSPTILPTMPSHSPTILPTIFTELTGNSKFILNQFHWIIITLSLLCIIIVIVLILFSIHLRNRNAKKLAAENTLLMSNPMVILVCIGDYDQDPNEPDLEDVYVNDLNVDIDIINLSTIFDKYNWSIFPKYGQYPKIHWSQKELVIFLQDRAKYFEDNISFYDGLIFVISCHGIKHYIITSDYQIIEKIAIHRIFSVNHPKARQVPRLFIFDCCDGSEEQSKTIVSKRIRKPPTINKQTTETEINKGFTVNDIKNDNESGEWSYSNVNPDYRLITVHASNAGYQSKMDTVNGSYLINGVCKQLATDVQNKNATFLYEIFDEIQEDLHNRGKQQTVNTFSNNTRFVKFKINRSNDKEMDNEFVEVPVVVEEDKKNLETNTNAKIEMQLLNDNTGNDEYRCIISDSELEPQDNMHITNDNTEITQSINETDTN
eukprot:413027_1